MGSVVCGEGETSVQESTTCTKCPVGQITKDHVTCTKCEKVSYQSHVPSRAKYYYITFLGCNRIANTLLKLKVGSGKET